MLHPCIRYKGEFGGMRLLRSVITPFCQRNALAVSGGINRSASRLGSIVDSSCCAGNISRQGPQIADDIVLPQKGVLELITADVGGANHLSHVVDRETGVVYPSAKIAEINRLHAAFSPK